ncbi:hypothetical protein [Streptomyces sp. NPDC002588]|uniref:hypothetical protein n=1 Tax=Streptomyces sp. NPDC002588 TaxID=3154419 RepID=UPI003330518D
MALTAMITVGLLATGCSASPLDSAADAPPTPPVIAAAPTAPATGYDALTRLPLSGYSTSEQDDDLLFRTQKALVIRCMKDRGHKSYSGRNITQITAKTPADKEVARPVGAWGYIGRATAKRRGFHTGIRPTGGATGLSRQVLQDYQTCSGEAGEQLPDLTDTQGFKLTQTLFGQSFQRTDADQRVTAARKRWAACMTTAGHPAQDPEKLAAGPWNAAEPTDDEIAAATADESCTRSSSLAAIYFAVLTGYQRQLISANAPALTAYKKQVQERTDKATRLLAKSPPI